MQSVQKHPFKDSTFITGLILIGISSGFFVMPALQPQRIDSDSNFGLFLLHYLLAIFYLIASFKQGFIKFGWRLSKNHLHHTLLFLVLSLISAFALNRDIPVFQDSTDWLIIYLVLACAACIAYGFTKYLPLYAQHLIYFVLGTAFLMFCYFSIYLLPIYGLGIVASFFLGVSLHAFVPLLFCIYLAFVLREAFHRNKSLLISALSGIILPIGFFIYFLTNWVDVQVVIRHTTDENIMEDKTALPQWVLISQKLPVNWITERVLKSDLVYDIPNNSSSFWRMPSRSFDEVKKHDPLVMTATFFYPHQHLDENDRIKILEALYDSRHQAQDRLWSGKDLKTSHVITYAKIYPQYRFAYTEKIINIQHTGPLPRWGSGEQEAIYTFHMPEGSVVTSLSLWIEGVEEKAYLTTKSKADSAYKTIVGRERRDPSVVHWQEGNTVSVRVFPCLPAASRRFKLGITSPLRKVNDKLVYENIYFQGPSFKDATENIQVSFEYEATGVHMPVAFTHKPAHAYQYQGSYKPYWEITCESPAISTGSFSFDGKTYSAKDYQEQYTHFAPETFYLDINEAWTKSDFEQVWKAVQGKKVYVYTTRMIQLNEQNKNELFHELQELKFSLFPFHKISSPTTALVITKSKHPSPNLSDIKLSTFSNEIKAYFQETKQIPLFNIGYQLTPYLKTLKELRVFTYAHGDINQLEKLLQAGNFVKEAEDAQALVLTQANLILQETEGNAVSTAPDHLLRLFAYNNIMRKVNTNYLADDFITEDVIREAEKAYVVSPVSSLIVLETQKDYERFDIKESKNSLKNASHHSSGAVPEPHEWMLIILTVIVVSYFMCKHYLWK